MESRMSLEISERIMEYLRRELGPFSETVSLDTTTPLIENGLLDSLGVQKVARFLEVEFGIDIHPHDIRPQTFTNVVSLARLVESKLPRSRASRQARRHT